MPLRYRAWSQLDRNPFDLIERNLVACAIVELGRTGAFVRGHGLGVFQRAAALKVGRNPRGAKCVTANPTFHAEFGRAALNHAPRVDAIHCDRGERAGAAGGGAE